MRVPAKPSWIATVRVWLCGLVVGGFRSSRVSAAARMNDQADRSGAMSDHRGRLSTIPSDVVQKSRRSPAEVDICLLPRVLHFGDDAKYALLNCRATRTTRSSSVAITAQAIAKR